VKNTQNLEDANIDAEIQALRLSVDAFNMVDRATAIRMLAYLQNRFVDCAAQEG
jgi:hypothetical protein